MEKKERHYKQGLFKPANPEKYIGDPTNIVYRSGWEKKFMNYLDENLSIIRWGSEEVVVPYISPVDNRPHRYFVDFYVEAKGVDGSIKKMLVEIKPYAQTLEPKMPKKKTKRFITEVMTYGVNQAKWKAAQNYCDKKGWVFQVLTENEIFPGKKSK